MRTQTCGPSLGFMKTLQRLTVLAVLLGSCSCYPLRNARIVDGTENQKTVWVCVPEVDEPLNVGGLECARMDNALGLSPVKHDPTKPADAGMIDL